MSSLDTPLPSRVDGLRWRGSYFSFGATTFLSYPVGEHLLVHDMMMWLMTDLIVSDSFLIRWDTVGLAMWTLLELSAEPRVLDILFKHRDGVGVG